MLFALQPRHFILNDIGWIWYDCSTIVQWSVCEQVLRSMKIKNKKDFCDILGAYLAHTNTSVIIGRNKTRQKIVINERRKNSQWQTNAVTSSPRTIRFLHRFDCICYCHCRLFRLSRTNRSWPKSTFVSPKFPIVVTILEPFGSIVEHFHWIVSNFSITVNYNFFLIFSFIWIFVWLSGHKINDFNNN